MKKQSKQTKSGLSQIFLRCILILSVLAFAYSGYRLADILLQERASKNSVEELIDSYVTVDEDPANAFDTSSQDPSADGTDSGNSDSQATTPSEDNTPSAPQADTVPISVDFEKLQATCPDIIGWLYCPDTVINYPVVQAKDNSYYLHRLIDGSSNAAGTLFMDYMSASDLSDPYSLIYGHNMKNNTMFGTLTEYNNQSYYNEHPVMYFLTPTASYRLDLVAGYLTDSDSETYQLPVTSEEAETLLQHALSHSTFTAAESDALTFDPNAHYLALSTCSYEHEEARYVLFGSLVELEK